MKILQLIGMVCLVVLPASAGTIVDVSTYTTLELNSGDTLYFMVSNLSLHTDLDSVEFQFVTESLDPTAQFEAILSSRDGSVQVDFPALQVISGVFAGNLYNGPITSLFGSLEFPGNLSGQIFQNTRATLVLRNEGAAVTVGLPGYPLAQDLLMSLQAGNTSAGAFISQVLYEDPPPVPESNPVALIALGTAILGLLGMVRKRIHTPVSDSARYSQIQRLQSGRDL